MYGYDVQELMQSSKFNTCGRVRVQSWLYILMRVLKTFYRSVGAWLELSLALWLLAGLEKRTL